MRIFLPIFAAVLILAGCQRPPVVYDVPSSQSYDRDPATIWPAILSFLDANGLATVEADQASGRIVATLTDYQPRDWAACKPARVIDRQGNSNRRDRGRPVDRQLQLDIQVEAAGGGSEVRPQASFTERQINPFKNLPFQVSCLSTGNLERSLLAAIERG